MTKFPLDMKHWTLDEAAECLDVSRGTAVRLWGYVTDAPKGEVPEPDSPERMTNSLARYWNQLTESDRQEIVAAYMKDHQSDA